MGSRVQVVPVRGWGGGIQGWAVNYQDYEYHFDHDRVTALDLGHYLARRVYGRS